MREKLISWLSGSQPGDRVVYHVGSLQHDRSSMRVHEVGRVMWEAMENRCVLLVQRKALDGEFHYIAIKRKPPYRALRRVDRRRKEWM